MRIVEIVGERGVENDFSWLSGQVDVRDGGLVIKRPEDRNCDDMQLESASKLMLQRISNAELEGPIGKVR